MSAIRVLGEKRGEVYVNGELRIDEKLWDVMMAIFAEEFPEDESERGDESI